MKNIKKLILQDEVNREAEQIEQEVLGKEELRSVEVTEEMDQELERRIRAYEEAKAERKKAYTYTEEFAEEPDAADAAEPLLSEKDREALELGRRILEKKERLRMPRKRKAWVALVAMMVLLLAVGITSVGNKSYWKELWRRVAGNQKNTVINVEEMESKETEDGDVIDCYREINDVLAIRTVYPRQIPKKMHLKNYEIDEQQRLAKVFYEYDGKTILYAIYVNDMDSSYSEKVEDKQTDIFEVETEKQTITVEEYYIQKAEEYRYITYFEYEGIHYQFMGVMEREDFEEILKNLYYF